MSENTNRNKNSKNNSSSMPRKTKNSVKSSRKKQSKVRRFFRRMFLVFITIFLILTFAVAGAGFGIYMQMIENSPNLDLLAISPDAYNSIVYDMDGNEIDRFHGVENREYVSLSEIPSYLQDAFVAIEDERFYSHIGIDIRGILRAGITTLTSKITGSSRVEGASTITQQLIKNNVTNVTRNTIQTKINEIYLAINYENQLAKSLGSKQAAKQYILELYLNTIALGHGYYGVQAASIAYFNKNASELTLAECASIAAITNNPTLYSPRINAENNKSRQVRILNKMLEQKMITQAEYDEAIEEDIYTVVSNSYQQQLEEGGSIHSYFVDSVFDQVSKDLQEKYNLSSAQASNLIYSGGLEIFTTQDSSIQKILNETYLDESLFPSVNYSLDVTYTVSVRNDKTGEESHSEYREFVKNKEQAESFIENKRSEIESNLSSDEYILADKSNIVVQPQSAMVIMDQYTGEVRGLIGGRGDKEVNRGFNRATDSLRQPGSVFKVLAAFAPGIDLNVLTPATVIDDVPYTIGDYSPSNWYSGYRGLSTIRDAIRDSMNIVAVKAMVQTGVSEAYKYLLNFGFTSLENDDHASTALGGITHGVSQLELTAAFATIANGGTYIEPKFYTKVLDRNGEVLLESNIEETSRQVIKETTAFLLTDMMKDVVTSGTGAKAKFTSSSMPIAGKTGTSQDSKDLTFVGYTPYYTAGIWLGYDRYDSVVKNMSNLSQSNHLIVWRTVMEKIHSNLAIKDFEKPSGIVEVEVCVDSGLLPGEYCHLDPRGSRVRTEYFVAGTEPTEICDVHVGVTVCAETGLLVGDDYPLELTKTLVGLVKKNLYTGTETINDHAYLLDIPTEYCSMDGSSHTTSEVTEEEDLSDFLNSNTHNHNSSSNSNSSSTTNTGNNTSNNYDDIFGSIIPSAPSEENTTHHTHSTTEQETQNIETNTNSSVETQKEEIGEPLIDSPN